MTIVTVALLIAGLIVVVVAVLARLTSVARRRRETPGSVSEAQARANAAPLTTAILARDRRERTNR